MSIATTRNIRRGSWVLSVTLLLVSSEVDAVVSVHPQDSVDNLTSVLIMRIITDDGEPVGSAWNAYRGQLGLITDDLEPVDFDIQANDGPLGIITEDPDPMGSAWQLIGDGPVGDTILNPDGQLNGDGEPSVLIHPETGLAMVVWAQSSAGGYDIVLSRFVAGAWTPPEVLVGSGEDELDPFLFIDPADGSVHLVYWIHDAGPRVMHTQAPSDLSGWTAAQQVSSFGEIAVRPTAVFGQGTLQVVYERHDLGYGSTPRQIVLAIKTGSTFTTQSVGSTVETFPNWPEVHAHDDKLWVDWLHSPCGMAWTVHGPSGWEPIRLEGFTGTEDRVFRVRGRIEIQALE